MENMNNKMELEGKQDETYGEDYSYESTTVKPEMSLAEKILMGLAIGGGVLGVKALIDKAKPIYENWKDQKDIARLKRRGYKIPTEDGSANTEYYECYEEVASDESTEE
jgi:hypothetical protein